MRRVVPIPSTRFILALLIPAPIFVILPPQWSAQCAVGYNVFLVILLIVDILISPRPSQLSVSRIPHERLSLGSPNEIGWQMANSSNYTIRLKIKEDLSNEIQKTCPLIQVTLLPQTHGEITYEVIPTQRGLFEFRDIHIRYESLLKLAEFQRTIPGRQPVKVYPNVSNMVKYELAVQRHRLGAIGVVLGQSRGTGGIFESLRDYVPGDDPTDIAWKATAKRNTLMVRNYEAERNQNIFLLIDCGRLMGTKVDDFTRLDYAVNASILLTYVAMQQGDNIGLIAFSDRIETYVPSTKGRRVISMMNEALYRLEPRLRESSYDQAFRFLAAEQRKRSLIVFFTDVIDRSSSSLLLTYVASLAKRHIPLVVTMKNLELEELATDRPADIRDCYSKAIAIQIRDRRLKSLQEMRASGVDVLDIDPRIATPKVLERYLLLKRRRRF